MLTLTRSWGHMHYATEGAVDAPAILWANSLGTDLRMWDGVVARLPGWRHLRFDKRGHGLSATPAGEWDVTDLAGDAVALMDHLGVQTAVVAGCSVGGMIAQGVALGHPERVTALILSNTAARIGTPEMWQPRIDAVLKGGVPAIAEAVLDRWFGPAFRASPEAAPWGTMLRRSDLLGYAGTCGALSRADFRAEVGRISVPTLMIAGTADQATPPALVAETAAMIPGARLVTLEGSGHIPAIDAPGTLTATITAFLS